MRAGVTIPYIRVPGLLAEDECESLVALHAKRPQSVLLDRETGPTPPDDGARSVIFSYQSDPRQETFFKTYHMKDERISWIFQRLESLLRHAARRFGFDVSDILEPLQILEIGITSNEYRWETDLESAHLSNRKLLAIVALQAVEPCSGGLVSFPEPLPASVPESLPGDAIIFPAYRVFRFTNVTAGRRRLLLARMAGPEFR